MPKDTAHLKRLAVILDDSIPLPGTNYRIGVDALVGLFPGIGDFIGTAMSSYIVLQAAHLGISIPTIARMLINIMIEGIIGSIPFFGDVMDAFFKANMRNLALIEREITTGKPLRSSKLVLFFVTLALIAILALIVALIFFVVRGFFEVISTAFT